MIQLFLWHKAGNAELRAVVRKRVPLGVAAADDWRPFCKQQFCKKFLVFAMRLFISSAEAAGIGETKV
jgi:hypothetical protein